MADMRKIFVVVTPGHRIVFKSEVNAKQFAKNWLCHIDEVYTAEPDENFKFADGLSTKEIIEGWIKEI